MTTPQAILTGFTLVALAIASLPYSNGLISPAFAYDDVMKIAICDELGYQCADFVANALKVRNNGN